ncbi:CS1 fimbrial subunit B flags: Precursor [Stenotrophomonas rhizophila]|uniref:CS1 fimbrial subunit B flags: Precursor n=1 Tax=Stenotrophomonas rhizophila TaxID=216778 RepID=UPI001E6489A8|nr:CS1 fimbrial subunit B flags: Precursor [Stenotrophomonas rhizophila]
MGLFFSPHPALRTCCSRPPLRLLPTLLAGSVARYWISLMRSLLLMPALLAVMATAHASSPNINVGAMYEYLEPGRSTLLKRVRNSGDATAFVRVEITEVVYDEDGRPRELPKQDEAAGHTVPSLVASPARMIVPAQGQQATRLLYQRSREQERYYRLRFVPVQPKTADEFGLDETQAAAYRQQLSAGVKVLTGYGVFVIVHPAAARYQVRRETLADADVLHNDGNSTVILQDLRQCTGSGTAEQCSPARTIHLLPGSQRRFERLAGQHHRLEIVEGEQRRSIAFGL